MDMYNQIIFEIWKDQFVRLIKDSDFYLHHEANKKLAQISQKKIIKGKKFLQEFEKLATKYEIPLNENWIETYNEGVIRPLVPSTFNKVSVTFKNALIFLLDQEKKEKFDWWTWEVGSGPEPISKEILKWIVVGLEICETNGISNKILEIIENEKELSLAVGECEMHTQKLIKRIAVTRGHDLCGTAKATEIKKDFKRSFIKSTYGKKVDAEGKLQKKRISKADVEITIAVLNLYSVALYIDEEKIENVSDFLSELDDFLILR